VLHRASEGEGFLPHLVSPHRCTGKPAWSPVCNPCHETDCHPLNPHSGRGEGGAAGPPSPPPRAGDGVASSALTG